MIFDKFSLNEDLLISLTKRDGYPGKFEYEGYLLGMVNNLFDNKFEKAYTPLQCHRLHLLSENNNLIVIGAESATRRFPPEFGPVSIDYVKVVFYFFKSNKQFQTRTQYATIEARCEANGNEKIRFMIDGNTGIGSGLINSFVDKQAFMDALVDEHALWFAKNIDLF